MNEKILCVDDDPGILSAYRRQLHPKFEVVTAQGGEEGLEAVDSQGPFAVVVADMRMPGMDGIQFLTHVRERAPDTVRMMLTGNADLQTAVDAVNEGCVARFLTKPCPPDLLARALADGVRQYRLVMGERELLQKTLTGSVKLLTDILALMNPTAFSRGVRVGRYVKGIAGQLLLPHMWQYELAGMLSQIGCVTAPPDVLERAQNGSELTPEERSMIAGHPAVGRQLLENVPRLGPIALMIEGQNRPFHTYERQAGSDGPDMVALGSQILKVALDFDLLVDRGQSHKAALLWLRRQPGEHNPQVLNALDDLLLHGAESRLSAEPAPPAEEAAHMEPRKISLWDVRVGMVAHKEIRAKNGLLLLPAGQEVTYPVLVRLRNFSRGPGVVEPIYVHVALTGEEEPADAAADPGQAA
jgi:response regulator RpfG family c-di-GMP phosphodiesterase